jgi:site-specific DNA-cytosine methylase
LKSNFGVNVVILKDMHNRVFVDGKMNATTMDGEKVVLSPGGIDVYFAGTDCRDWSKANRNSNVGTISWDARLSDSRSIKTLMQSLWTCLKLLPRVVVIENVRGCPFDKIIAFCYCDPAFASKYIVLGTQSAS